MSTILARVCLALIALAASGCAPLQPISVSAGPSAEVEVSTRQLKERGVLYPNEKVVFVVFRKADNTRLGGEVLTTQELTKSTRLPTDVALQVRMFKSVVYGGVHAICNGETNFTFEPNKRYRVRFDFDFNESDSKASICVGAIESLAAPGVVATSVPLSISKEYRAVLFLPINVK